LTAVLITAVLALLLVAYVFGASKPREDRVAASPGAGAASCSSRETSELLKRELFGRAMALRGRDQAGMGQVAQYSVVRIASAKARDGDGGAGSVICTASLALDLPPQVAVVGGRRSLGGQAEYRLLTGRDGAQQLRLLSNADAIVTPLAALTGVGTDEALPAPPPPVDENAVAEEPASLPPPIPPQARAAPPTLRQQAQNRPPPPPPVRAQPPAKRQAAVPPPRQAPKVAEWQPAPPRETVAKQAPPPAPKQTTSEPVREAAVARPSFDCRRARARSEIAVCGDAGLASLDRRMSAQFFAALRSARPGQRALLQRSRSRFLAYRNRCGSSACIAEAYRARIREIDTIMTGGF
jgi:hypothetical protein